MTPRSGANGDLPHYCGSDRVEEIWSPTQTQRRRYVSVQGPQQRENGQRHCCPSLSRAFGGLCSVIRVKLYWYCPVAPHVSVCTTGPGKQARAGEWSGPGQGKGAASRHVPRRPGLTCLSRLSVSNFPLRSARLDGLGPGQKHSRGDEARQ